MALTIAESALTEEVLAGLISLSEAWEAEENCYGYRANGREELEGHRIFLARDGGRIIGYLFGHCFRSEHMRSIMPEGSACFEVEELYVIPARRSEGIGGALLSRCEEAVQGEADYITLSTAAKNWKAVLHFYLDEAGMSFWSARLFKRISEE